MGGEAFGANASELTRTSRPSTELSTSPLRAVGRLDRLPVWKCADFRVFSIRKELLASAAGMHATMRFIHAVVAVAIAVPLIAPVVLMDAPSAHADDDGYFRCVANIRNLPLAAPDPNRCCTLPELSSRT